MFKYFKNNVFAGIVIAPEDLIGLYSKVVDMKDYTCHNYSKFCTSSGEINVVEASRGA